MARRRCRPRDRSIDHGRWRIFARTAGPGLTLIGPKKCPLGTNCTTVTGWWVASRIVERMWMRYFAKRSNERLCDALGYYHQRRDENRDVGLGPEHDSRC